VFQNPPTASNASGLGDRDRRRYLVSIVAAYNSPLLTVDRLGGNTNLWNYKFPL